MIHQPFPSAAAISRNSIVIQVAPLNTLLTFFRYNTDGLSGVPSQNSHMYDLVVFSWPGSFSTCYVNSSIRLKVAAYWQIFSSSAKSWMISTRRISSGKGLRPRFFRWRAATYAIGRFLIPAQLIVGWPSVKNWKLLITLGWVALFTHPKSSFFIRRICSSKQWIFSYIRFCHSQNPLWPQYRILILVRLRLQDTNRSPENGSKSMACSTRIDIPLMPLSI